MPPMDSPVEIVTTWRDRLRFDPGNINIFHDSFRKMTRQFDSAGPDMFRIRDFFVPGVPEKTGCLETPQPDIPVRLYEPYNLPDGPGPVFVYIHGGGFVTCDLDSHDGICRRLALGTGMRVLAIDYRLAPACPFPSANDDCETVIDWLVAGHGLDRGLDPDGMVIGGDSAGGTLTAHLVQERPKLFRAQVLFYPLLQLVETKPHTPGIQDKLGFGEVALGFIQEHYVNGADPHDPRLSPLFTEDLRGLPPTYILTCGLDPLRFEGRAYADKLAAAGVRVETLYEKALPHGFLNFARAFKRAKVVPLEAADFVRKHLV